ncbi:MAG TPA: LamG domain-containing protein [Polyangiaceae bacterium]|nr:LamG domain-containing protein [Polyangiaceae bacterium]
MARAPSLLALVASACLLACGETRVTLLEPILDSQGGRAPIDAALGGSGGGNHSGGKDADDAGAPPSSTPPHLLHRYGFDGEGTRVVDSVGSADGMLMGGAVLDGAGHVTLDGSDDYVNLPNGLISGLSDVTLVAWLAWNGGPCWQRVFDFGSSDAGEDNVGNATSSLFATAKRCGNPDPELGPAAAMETTEGILGSVDGHARFPELNRAMLAVSVDGSALELSLYAAGKPLGTGKAVPLALLTDENDWLGRSQWVQDEHLQGTFDEFRIYDVVLSDTELAAIEAAGPGAP